MNPVGASPAQGSTGAYIERAQALAREDAKFKAASAQQKADVLEEIREQGSTMHRNALTVEQAADAAWLLVLPIPWCQRCAGYHHDAAPHIGEQRS